MSEFGNRKLPWLRYAGWVLFPVLVFLPGQTLEGPAYRVIVHSVSFQVAVFAVSALASAFVWRLRCYLPLFGLIYVLLVSMGFIWSAQHYYDGGKNSDYLLYLVVWSIPMVLNLLLYLNSLFAPVNRKFCPESPESVICREDSSADHQALPVGHFDVRLFTVAKDGRAEHLYYQLRGGPPLPEGFFLDGYSHDHFVSLTEHWSTIMEQRLHRFTTPVTLYETIIKFGETQQLVQNYVLEIETSFD